MGSVLDVVLGYYPALEGIQKVSRVFLVLPSSLKSTRHAEKVDSSGGDALFSAIRAGYVPILMEFSTLVGSDARRMGFCGD